MEFWKFFVFTISLFFLIKNFWEFSDKINNPYNKAPQKYLEFFDWLGEVGKKGVKNANKKNK